MMFLKSIFVIGHAFIRHFGWLEGGRSVLHGARQLIQATFTKESDLSSARMASCKKCQMMDSEFSTCGTPGQTYKASIIWQGTPNAGTHSLGCWCYLPLANRIASKDCWARVNGIAPDVGWPDELRPKL